MSDRVLLYLHGINNDDRERTWLTALNNAMRRNGLARVEEQGFKVVAPSYLKHLTGDEPEGGSVPAYTSRRESDRENSAAQQEFLVRQAKLSQRLRQSGRTSSPLSLVPQRVADRLIAEVTEQADRYVKSDKRRQAIMNDVLEKLPYDGEIVIVAHSLGSVVAADLLFHLPPRMRVSLLVTAGSPLRWTNLQLHLNRLRYSFPHYRVDAWLNVVGRLDPVAGGRGLATVFAEVLDYFVDTASGADLRNVHKSSRYLDQDCVVDAIKWLEVDSSGKRDAHADWDNGLLPVLAGAQFGLRIEQNLGVGSRRTRYGEARELVGQEVLAYLNEGQLLFPNSGTLLRDHSDALRGRLDSVKIVGILLSAVEGNPIAPYEIEVSDKVRRAAVSRLAEDLGRRADWASTVFEAVKQAQSAHKAFP